MSNIAHFSINADDVKRACHFYENVFGWKFEQMGPLPTSIGSIPAKRKTSVACIRSIAGGN